MTKYKIRAVLAGVSCAVKVFKKVLFVLLPFWSNTGHIIARVEGKVKYKLPFTRREWIEIC